MRSGTINDSLFEALFRQAVIDNFEEEFSFITSNTEFAKPYVFSDSHAARMEKLFKSADRAEKLQAAAKWVRRSAAVFIVALAVLFGALMTVPEVRAIVVKVAIEWLDQFSQFTSEQVDPDEMAEWEISYMPERFMEIERDNFAGTLTISYIDQAGTLIDFTCLLASGSISVDNENQDYYVVEDNSIIYHVFENREAGELSIIVWDNEGYRFSVKALLSINELLLVAASVEKR